VYPPPTPYLHGRTHTAPPACVSTAHSRSTDVSTGGPLYSRVKKLSSSAPTYVFKDITFLTDIIGGAAPLLIYLHQIIHPIPPGNARVKSPQLTLVAVRHVSTIWYTGTRFPQRHVSTIGYTTTQFPQRHVSTIWYIHALRIPTTCVSHTGTKKATPQPHTHRGAAILLGSTQISYGR
jgi:hypothetical protein